MKDFIRIHRAAIPVHRLGDFIGVQLSVFIVPGQSRLSLFSAADQFPGVRVLIQRVFAFILNQILITQAAFQILPLRRRDLQCGNRILWSYPGSPVADRYTLNVTRGSLASGHPEGRLVQYFMPSMVYSSARAFVKVPPSISAYCGYFGDAPGSNFPMPRSAGLNPEA